MRSILFALVLAAPVCAVASTPNPTYSHPMDAVRQQKEQMVLLTFVNHSAQERELRIGTMQYRLSYAAELHIFVPVGSVVRVYSNQNSKLNGQELMQVTALDSGRSVLLN